MNYYIVATDTGKIVKTINQMSADIIYQLANEFRCSVYAIVGEHSGFSALWLVKSTLAERRPDE